MRHKKNFILAAFLILVLGFSTYLTARDLLVVLTGERVNGIVTDYYSADASHKLVTISYSDKESNSYQITELTQFYNDLISQNLFIGENVVIYYKEDSPSVAVRYTYLVFVKPLLIGGIFLISLLVGIALIRKKKN
jgi:hypothetical protein